MVRRRLWVPATALLLLLAVAIWATLVMGASDSQAEAAALFQGPAQGTSAVGATGDTADVGSSDLIAQESSGGARVVPIGRIQPIQLPIDVQPLSSPPAASNEVDDAAASFSESGQASSPLTPTTSFKGLTDVGDAFNFLHIPPDPIMAAGPSHVIGAVNTSFGIFAKSGTLQKRIDGTLWFQNVLPNKIGNCASTALGCVFDPNIDSFVKTPRQAGARQG